MPDAKGTIPVEDEAVEDTNVDATAEDEQVDQSESKQLQSEASDLDDDDSPGVTTRGAKVDALQQEREIDQAIEDAEAEDDST